MGYEIKYSFHPKMEDGGYNKEVVEEKTKKVGKPFDDTPLEKCAAAILAQLARRDVWVIDVKICELVKKEISFKEAKDGKGIVLKNKKFSLGSTAQLVEEVGEEVALVPSVAVSNETRRIAQNSNVQHPHELIKVNQDVEAQLYSGAPSVSTGISPRSVDQSRSLYKVIFNPNEQHKIVSKRLKLDLSVDQTYTVHANYGNQIAVTDNGGNVLIVDQSFFDVVGAGLVGDDQLGFSQPSDVRAPKLLHEDDSYIEVDDMPKLRNFPVDDGTIPDYLDEMPTLRPE